MVALARLTFAQSPFDAVRLLKEMGEWLDFGDEDEERLYRCYVNWFYAITPKLRPHRRRPRHTVRRHNRSRPGEFARDASGTVT